MPWQLLVHCLTLVERSFLCASRASPKVLCACASQGGVFVFSLCSFFTLSKQVITHSLRATTKSNNKVHTCNNNTINRVFRENTNCIMLWCIEPKERKQSSKASLTTLSSPPGLHALAAPATHIPLVLWCICCF